MRKIAIGAAIAVLTGAAILTASAPAVANTDHTSGKGATVATGNTAPVPGRNRGESATFRVVDTGTKLLITGRARGMLGATNYVSLIYPDNACSTPIARNTGMTLNDTWQERGDQRQTITAVYDGAAYRAVKAGGGIGSVSIRAVTAVKVAPVATASLEARACANITPNVR